MFMATINAKNAFQTSDVISIIDLFTHCTVKNKDGFENCHLCDGKAAYDIYHGFLDSVRGLGLIDIHL